MKGLLCISLAMLAGAALGDGFTSVQVNGNSYSNISKAYAGSKWKNHHPLLRRRHHGHG